MFSSEPIISVAHAQISQQGTLVLSDVSFTIEKGEFVYVVGRTGAGKSSLLKMLYADLPLLQGEARVGNFQINKISKKKIPYLRRKVGIVFQDFQLFFDRTVEENLTFVMRATGWSNRSKIKIRTSEVLMQVGLEGVGKKFPHQLSGGEQQRVVIARALINEPIVLFADEPTGNLDPEVAFGILEVFKKISLSGTAIIMATHSYGLISHFPARILKCEEGKLLDSNLHTITLPSGT